MPSIATLIHNAIIFDDCGRYSGYLAIDTDGYIAETAPGMPSESMISASQTIIDAKGAWLLPGVIDEHVHFRDPGLTDKADISTESLAAAAGGVTSVMDMPNTIPPTVTIDAWEEKMRLYAQKSVVNYSCWIGASSDNFDQLEKIDWSKTPGVKIFAGTSTGNMAVNDNDLYHRIFTEIPAIKAIHSEDDAIISANALKISEKYGSPEKVPVKHHPDIRSRQACTECTRRLVELQQSTKARMQIMHVSTSDELQFFAKGDSTDSHKLLTAETCVQYLWWDDSDYESLGARIKCNPAIKRKADKEALRQAVNDGLIDIIATDHAPHMPADKEGGALKAASGIPLIQFALPMMLELARKNIFPAETAVEKMCHAPARIFNIDRRGYIRKGYHADITLISAGDTPYKVDASDIKNKCGWSPLEGTVLHHRVLATWVNGQKVWEYGTGATSVKHKAAMPLIFNQNQKTNDI